jgi:transcriptional regulator with XRE-family HTH domain
MIPIGKELQKERELRGISLQEIAEATKINFRFLRELEEGNLDALPGEFFVRGILREYAKYLGLNEHDVLNTYFESLQSLQKEEIEIKKGSSGLPKNITSAIRIAALGAFIIAVLIGLFFIFGKKESPPPPKPKPKVSISKKTVSPPPESEKTKEEEIKVMELNLELSFHQDTWIQILADGEKVYSGIRLSGGKFEVTAKREIIIDLGNAGGLTYTINGLKGIPFVPKSWTKANSIVNPFREALLELRRLRSRDGGLKTKGPSRYRRNYHSPHNPVFCYRIFYT